METVDIIREVVEAIDVTFKAKTITDNGSNVYTLTTDNTKWLQSGFSITIGAVEYDITSVTKDVSIVITGSALPTIKTFDIYEPVYFHGTVIKVKGEMAGEVNAQNVFSRTPFIYLREIIEDEIESKYSIKPIKKTASLQLLFLTQCNFADWKIIDHYTHSIYPMYNLVDEFINALYKNKRIGIFETYKLKNHVNFGVYVTDKGQTKSIFTDNLSGIELNIELPFKELTTACSIQA
jgi:hypothetical protein